ncbi:DUF605-domain-containing protein [Rhizodiscina lignyota]|uniref:DUF605-domain-containing protein n=1 Tax=Rhizodiscina lignyota TaxID=1504668 RepID=A0A9P4IDM9_9PEZI|nr:DUF605-domain-containing protein [Rhizodiscina lignyota]
MAAHVPAGLKAPEISQFAMRAAQLEKFKPVISYWLEYCMVNQILDKGLHTNDDECMAYTTGLMDKLERTKAEHPDEAAIHDDMAAKAYVEQFAMDTFQRADNAVRANKVSAQTADTFRASATFLDLLSVFGPIEAEFQAKSKYAKYHAVRIAKAIKAGEDPNLSNPAREPSPEQEAPPLDPSDPEVQDINNAASLQPSVEDAPDSIMASPHFTPTAPPEVPSIQPPSGPPAPPTNVEVSPLEPSPNGNSRTNSVGGGYFPQVPTFTSEQSAPRLPTAPEIEMGNTDQNIDPTNFYNVPSPSNHTPTAPTPQAQPPILPQPSAHTPQLQPPVLPQPPIAMPQVPSTYAAPVAPTHQGPYRTDDEAVLNAQKHAKWAISALNFEDVNTAVDELRIALQSLGAA